MIFNVKRLLGLFVVTTALIAPAGVASAESLNDAMAAAYSSNPTLQAARANQRATDELVPRALSGWRPTVSMNADLRNTWSRTTNNVTRTFPPETVRVTRQENTSNAGVKITLSQPVFNGFATVEGVKQAEANVQAGRQDLLATEQNTIFNAVQAYMNVYADRQFVSLQQENVRVLKSQLNASDERFKVGEITRTDVAQSRASLSEAQATQSRFEAQLAADAATYLQIVGREPGKLGYPKIAKLPKSLKEALAAAGEINPSILAKAFVEEAAQRNIEVQKSALYPSIALEGSVQTRDDITARAGSSDEASVAAVFSWQIYGGGDVQASIRQAKQLASQRRIQVVETARAVRQAVAASWNSYASFGEIISLRNQQVDAAQLALEGVRQEYEAGTRTTQDVLDAVSAVVNAKLNLVAAQRDRVTFAYRLLASVGRLTARDLGLGVAYYDAEENYNAVRGKWIGTGVETVE